jgi:signal peptidase I
MGKDKQKEKVDEQVLELPPGAAKGTLRDNAELACFGVLLLVFLKTFVGQHMVIPTGSMRNTLMIGDHLIINKFIYAQAQWDWEAKLFPMRAVQRGDIITFRYPMNRDQDYVKRCVATPGDRVEIRDKRLYVNQKLITGAFEHHIVDGNPEGGPWTLGRNAGELYSRPEGNWHWDPALNPDSLTLDRQGMSPEGETQPYGFRDNVPPFTVPPEHILAMGDNRDNSMDSRYWGFVPVDHLRGRPFMVAWSFREGGNDDQSAKSPGGAGDVLMNYIDGARHFFTWSRWERTGFIPR